MWAHPTAAVPTSRRRFGEAGWRRAIIRGKGANNKDKENQRDAEMSNTDVQAAQQTKTCKTTRIPRGLANESQALPTRPTDQPCLGIPRRKLVEGMLSE